MLTERFVEKKKGKREGMTKIYERLQEWKAGDRPDGEKPVSSRTSVLDTLLNSSGVQTPEEPTLETSSFLHSVTQNEGRSSRG